MTGRPISRSAHGASGPGLAGAGSGSALAPSPSAAAVATGDGSAAGPGPGFRALGVRVDAVQIPEVVARMRRWIRDRERGRWVAVTGMHGVMVARDEPEFRTVLADADLVVPDGMSLVVLGRLNGHEHLERRCYGPELMSELCAAGLEDGVRHFLYGGGPEVAQALKVELELRHPGIRIVGTLTPPFRPLVPEEDAEFVDRIRAARPDVVWVGLSTPKQERWMWEHRDRLDVPVMVGVGAAFDLLSGRVRQAPRWMRERGLEWLWRLMMEPRRLWHRTLVLGPRFVLGATVEQIAKRVRGGAPDE